MLTGFPPAFMSRLIPGGNERNIRREEWKAVIQYPHAGSGRAWPGANPVETIMRNQPMAKDDVGGKPPHIMLRT